jgi:septation ring formation regulator EzrA
MLSKTKLNLFYNTLESSLNTEKHGLKQNLLINETNIKKCRANNKKSTEKMGYFKKNYIVNKINFDNIKALYL